VWEFHTFFFAFSKYTAFVIAVLNFRWVLFAGTMKFIPNITCFRGGNYTQVLYGTEEIVVRPFETSNT
jgi:hypothetical protein